jgi:hypothetical protein
MAAVPAAIVATTDARDRRQAAAVVDRPDCAEPARAREHDRVVEPSRRDEHCARGCRRDRDPAEVRRRSAVALVVGGAIEEGGAARDAHRDRRERDRRRGRERERPRQLRARPHRRWRSVIARRG